MVVETRAIGLRQMRERRGLRRQELADQLGLTLNKIVLLESGVAKPSPPLRRALMAYFDCDFEDLFEVLSVGTDDAG